MKRYGQLSNPNFYALPIDIKLFICYLFKNLNALSHIFLVFYLFFSAGAKQIYLIDMLMKHQDKTQIYLGSDEAAIRRGEGPEIMDRCFFYAFPDQEWTQHTKYRVLH